MSLIEKWKKKWLRYYMEDRAMDEVVTHLEADLRKVIEELKCVQRCNGFNKEIIVVSELEKEIGIERTTDKKETM